MDVEAELAYVDILRTLQNSILNSDTNVSCQGSVQLTGDVAVAVIMTPPTNAAKITLYLYIHPPSS